MAIKTITVDGTTYDIGVTVTNIEGTLPVSKGGTGVTSAPSLLTNLGSTSASNPFASAPRPGVTGTLPISRGGTGATTAAAAKAALGIEDTDTKVQQIENYTSGGFPLLASSMSQSSWTNSATSVIANTDIAINPQRNKITIRGNSSTDGGRINTWANSPNGAGFHLYDKDNSVYYGDFMLARQGTTSTTDPGLGALQLGNDTVIGTAGNAQGVIYIYGTNSGYSKILSGITGSTNYIFTLPSITGTAIVDAGAQTITGDKSFSGAVYFGGTTSYYVSTAGNSRFHNIIADGKVTLNSTLVGKSGGISTGNYTTTVPTSAGTTGQLMFVLQ